MNFSLTSLYAVMLVFTRIAVLFTAFPPFGGSHIPRFIRLAIAASLAFFITGLVGSQLPIPHHFLGYILALTSEMLIGVVMALAVRSVYNILSMAGFLIGNATSLSRDQNMNLGEDAGGGMIGGLFYYFATVVFLVLGLHHVFIHAIVDSFTYVPIGVLVSNRFAEVEIFEMTSRIFEIGLLMAAPFVATNFVITTTFALMGKVAQRVNVFMISFAVRILIGFMALSSTAGLMVYYVRREFSSLPDVILQLFRS